MATPRNRRPGIGNVGSYQVSGAPFAQGNINASVEHQRIQFPEVSIWVQVINRGAGIVKVGFSDVVPYSNLKLVHASLD